MKVDLDGFTASNGPAPFGAGYPSCAPPPADPWDDGLGQDTVAVVSSAYGEGGRNEPITAAESRLGAFVFRLRPEAPPGPASFRLEFDSCSPLIQMGLAIFDAAGNPLDLSFPSSQVEVQVTAGVKVRNLTCAPNPAGPGAAISWDAPTAPYDGVNIYRGGEKIRSMVPPFQHSLTDEEGAGVLVYELAVVARGKEELCRASCALDLRPSKAFVRGNVNGDGGVNIADAVALLNYLYRSDVLACLDAADVDDSGDLDISDVVIILSFLFQDGVPPQSPFPGAGIDTSADDLSCEGP